MNVKQAVKKKENYGSIVTYYKTSKITDMDGLVQLIDIIEEMSQEIFEHYKALCIIFKENVSKIISEYQGNSEKALSADDNEKFKYCIRKAIQIRVLLEEKYEYLLK